MKNVNKSVIAIIAAIASTLGCNETLSIPRTDNEQCQSELLGCVASEDAAWAEVSKWEENAEQTITGCTDGSVQNDVHDDSFEQCEIEMSSWEEETYRVGDMLEMCIEQKEGLNVRYDDVFDALQSVPVDIANTMCENGSWDAWICESLR